MNEAKHDDALPELLDLWSASASTQFERTTASTITRLVQQAAGAHQPTRDAFAAIRDTYEIKLNRLPDWHSLIGWIWLNQALDETERTLEWIDRIKGTPNGRSTICHVTALVEDLIQEDGDLRDLLFMRAEPCEWIVQRELDLESSLRFVPNSDSDRTLLVQSFRNEVALFHVAQWLGNKASTTANYRELAIDRDDTPHMRLALIEAALKRIPKDNPARATIRDWALPLLDQADTAIAALPDNPDHTTKADLTSRAAAARKALSQ